jgi:large subunit ribosomal protein L31
MNNTKSITYKNVKVVCTCGHIFETRSTFSGDTLKLEVCSNCHPFYNRSKETKRVTERAEKFNKKFSL